METPRVVRVSLVAWNEDSFFEAGRMQDLRGTSPPDFAPRSPMRQPAAPPNSAEVHCRRPNMRVSWPARARVATAWSQVLRSLRLALGAHVHLALGWRKTHPKYPQQIHGRILNYGPKSPSLLLLNVARIVCLILTLPVILLCIQHQSRLLYPSIETDIHPLDLFLCLPP